MSTQRRYRAAAIGRTGGGNYGHGLHLAYREIASSRELSRSRSYIARDGSVMGDPARSGAW